MKVYGDLGSGNCLKVKYTADRLGLSYTWITVDTIKGETRTPEFLARFPMARIPGVEFADGRCLAESNAIIRFLARGTALLPEDGFAQAKVDEWLFWEQYSHEPYVAVARFQMHYLGKPASDLDPKLVERGHAALARLEQGLGASGFLVGDRVSLADVALVAYTRVAHEGGFSLNDYPAVKAWVARVEAALKIV